MTFNLATRALVLSLLAMFTASLDNPEMNISNVELVRAYCRLVQNSRTYRLFKLETMCVVNVKIFGKHVRHCDFSHF